MNTFRLSLLLAALVTACLSAGEATRATKPARPSQPIQVKSIAQLYHYLHAHSAQNLGTFLPVIAGNSNQAAIAPTALAGASANLVVPAGGGPTFVGTNVQVAGVDESDFVKTDGSYIYQVQGTHVLVIQPTPANALAVVANIDLGSDFTPSELYVDGDRLVVLGTFFQLAVQGINVDPIPASPSRTSQRASAASNDLSSVALYVGPESQVLIYDISDKTNIKQLRKVGVVGGLIASRRIDHFLYLVTRQYPIFIYYDEGVAPGVSGGSIGNATALSNNRVAHRKHLRATAANGAPLVRDSAKVDALVPLPMSDIFIFPNFGEPDYLTITGLDIEDPSSPIDTKAYLGTGTDVFVSNQNLYVEATVFQRTVAHPPGVVSQIAVPASFSESSSIYKFALSSGTTTFVAQASVPGTILNAFSMDESNGNFRVATTSLQFGANGRTETNGVYVFDSAMNPIGKLENIAAGEQLYSARFINNRAYLVTFKRVDPLFVVDLSQPKPTLLGQLTVDGVSDYLQPFDATHIMGFGSDVNSDNEPSGFKMSLFDVGDPAHPALVNSVTIPYADSELQYDHRALLFDPTTGLLAFPITSNGNGGGILPLSPVGLLTQNQLPQLAPTIAFFSSFTEVYSVSSSGFTLRKQIPAETGDFVRRVLLINGTLYTISEGHIQAFDNASLQQQSVLSLPDSVPIGIGIAFPGIALQF